MVYSFWCGFGWVVGLLLGYCLGIKIFLTIVEKSVDSSLTRVYYST